MEDAIKSIKAHLYDRVVSPLSGAFIFSWVIWNYKLIIIIFSSATLAEKFKFINQFYSGSIDFYNYTFSLNSFLLGVCIPFFTAIAYIYLYPIISLPIYKYSLERQKKLKKAKQDYDGEILLSVNESLAIKNNLAKIKSSYESDIGDLNKTISDLNLEISNLNNEKNNSASNGGNSSFSIDFSSVDIKIKNRISSLSEGELFVLADAFGANSWNAFNNLEKEAIENVFKFNVFARLYEGIIFSGKNEIGVNTYRRSSTRFWEDFSLSDYSTKIIKYFVGLGPYAKSSLATVNEKISGNMFETDDSLERLHKAGYLSKATSSSANTPTTFSLTDKGKQYAIKNGYHI